jgi:hypothetical protein
VPVFSRIASDHHIPKKLSRMSAEDAVKHSLSLIEIATSFLNYSQEKSRLPSMVGYAMFVACTIRIKSLEAQGRLDNNGWVHMQPAMSILKQLKEYWSPLTLLVS